MIVDINGLIEMKNLKLLIIIFSVPIHSLAQNFINSDSAETAVFTQFGQENLGKDFPDFNFKSVDGKEYKNENLTGKTTLINFWYASCVPCISEFDALNSLFSKFKKNKDFQFLSFTFENDDTIKQIVRKYKLRYPIISISGDSLSKLNFHQGFPTNIIVDRCGRIERFFEGGVRTPEEARVMVNSVLIPAIKGLLNE